MTDNALREALKTAIDHIEHMSAWIALRNAGYSFESLGEDMPGLKSALASNASFQDRVRPWMLECFGEMIAGDREERNHRFLEEALELVQACGCTQHEAHQLVDYVYGRDQGEINQEVGGVMVTLAALCLANGMDMHAAGETELARIWTKVDQIRAKQAAKPKHSPLPGASDAMCGDSGPVMAGDCAHCRNGFRGSDIECVNGILIDIDEFTEGWETDVLYPPAPCHPLYCKSCAGTGRCPDHIEHDSDDCPDCDGTGYVGGKSDCHERLAAERRQP